MPRPKTAVPTYQHHKPSGQAFIRLTLPGGTRRTIYLGAFDSPGSKAEYARQIQTITTSSPATVEQKLAAPASTDLTVAELLVGFLDHADRYYRGADGKPTSSICVFKQVVKPVRELFAYLPAKEFGPNALKTVRARLF